MLSVFMAMVGLGIISPIIPNYASDLGASGLYIGLIYSSFSLSRATLQTPVGRLADIYSKKKIIVAGLILYGIVSIVYTYVTSPETQSASIENKIAGVKPMNKTMMNAVKTLFVILASIFFNLNILYMPSSLDYNRLNGQIQGMFTFCCARFLSEFLSLHVLLANLRIMDWATIYSQLNIYFEERLNKFAYV